MNRHASYWLSVHSSQNNSTLPLTDSELKVDHLPIRTLPGMHGMHGHKKFNRSTYEASHAYMTAEIGEGKGATPGAGPQIAMISNGLEMILLYGLCE